ncbi:hypothetical protein V8C42DRAFT_66320 [Trichoderma barbatum]
MEIFLYGTEKKCTDAKDRIFALFGIFQELDITLPAPDYSELLDRIYAAAAVACFTNDSCMDFLYHVPSENRRAGLPSWAIDWGDAAQPTADQCATVTKKPFTASGKFESENALLRARASYPSTRIRCRPRTASRTTAVGESPPTLGDRREACLGWP